MRVTVVFGKTRDLFVVRIRHSHTFHLQFTYVSSYVLFRCGMSDRQISAITTDKDIIYINKDFFRVKSSLCLNLGYNLTSF